MQGTSRDVTERVQAQQALAASETKFRSLAESMAVAVFIAQDTTLRYVNSAAIAMTGYPEDELVGKSFWNVMHPDDRELARTRGLARQQGTVLPPHFEYRIRTRAGQDVWVDFRAAPMAMDGTPALLGTAIDITARKRMAIALSASERRYRSLIESQREVIARAAADDAQTLTFVNDAFCKVFGRARADLVGQSWVPLCEAQDVPIAIEAVAATQRPPYRTMVEWRIHTVAGVRWYEWEICGVRDAQGTVVEVQGVGRDVTARKEAEDGLRTSLAQLTRSEDKLRQLALGQVAIREEERKRLGLDLHDDVCQELVGIGIMLEAVRRRIAPSGEAGTDLGRATRYLNEVVEHLRALASDLRPLQLRDLGLVGSLRALAQGTSTAHATIDLACPEPIPTLDEETELALYRVAQEGILNALRHGRARHVEMTLTVASAWIRLEVHDDGRGLDGVDTDGRGLGLVSMEERALSLGGRFRMASTPGQGTTMLFECPLLERSSAA
jgi:PAS domain S-box-containing protein